MLQIATIAAFLFASTILEPLAPEGDPVLGTRKVRYRLELSDFEKAPQWDDFDKSPPLQPGKAIRVGEKALKAFTDEGLLKPLAPAFCWEVSKISLVSKFPNHWYYEVEFYEALKPGNASSGSRQSATIYVLMNETFVRPVNDVEKSVEPSDKK